MASEEKIELQRFDRGSQKLEFGTLVCGVGEATSGVGDERGKVRPWRVVQWEMVQEEADQMREEAEEEGHGTEDGKRFWSKESTDWLSGVGCTGAKIDGRGIVMECGRK